MRSSRYFIMGAALLALLALSAGPMSTAGEKGNGKKAATMKAGDKAPIFESIDDQGKPFKSTDVVGKKVVVVFFFPAALTGGWTAQACGFRDETEDLKKAGAVVIGVSGDSPENQKFFKKEKMLNYTLLGDEKGDVAKAFGIPVGKGGVFPYKDAEGNVHNLKRGSTISRYHVVIDKEGVIVAIDPVKNAGGDAKEVLAIVKKLEK